MKESKTNPWEWNTHERWKQAAKAARATLAALRKGKHRPVDVSFIAGKAIEQMDRILRGE